METFWQDVRYGLRMLAKSPGFTVVAVITLALGIGANTAIFSVVNALLFRPLPVEKPEELVGIYTTEKEFISHVPLAYPDYRDIREHNRSFTGVIGYSLLPVALERGDESQLVIGEVVTGNYFDVLGLQAARGRTFQPEEDRTPGTHPVVVLSYGTWQRRFGGDANIVGQTIRLNGRPLTVVGVAPASFHGLIRGLSPELWVPTMMLSTLRAPTTVNVDESSDGGDRLENRRARWMWVMARLQPGVTLAQAKAEVVTLNSRLAQEYPESNKDRHVDVLYASNVKFMPGIDQVLYGTSFVLMALVGLVLLIASANVANMLLARAAARRKEIAVRLSLGASRGRLIRQLLTESLLLSLLGGALGLAVAWWSNGALNAIRLPLPVQLALNLSLDARVLAYTLAAAMLTALLFGLAPAWQASKTDLATALKEEGRSSMGGKSKRRLRNTLVVAQVALSLMLLICAGLSIRSLQNAHRINPGFEAQGLVQAQLDPGLSGYTPEQGANFYREFRERVQALPGVESAALASHLPLSFSVRIDSAVAEGGQSAPERDWPSADSASVGPGYFATMRIPILRGREFGESDTKDRPRVAVVNETLAAKFWPQRDSIGQRVYMEKDQPPYEVVGVARDGKYRTLGEQPRPFIYRNVLQKYEGGQTLLVRVAGDVRPALAAVRQQARQLDEKIPVVSLGTVAESIGVSLLLPRMGATLFGVFGLLGLALASVGLYGVIAYMVSQRTHEIGIRMALGAQRSDIFRLVVGQGMRLTAIGVAIGLAGALGLTQLIAVILYGVSPNDALTYAGVALGLLGVAVVACYIPARRAVRVDPMIALRYE